MLKHMRVARKLALGFGGTLAALLFICAGVMVQEQASIGIADESATANRVMIDIERVLGSLFEQSASIRGLILLHDPRFAQQYRAAGVQLDAALADARVAAADDAVVLGKLNNTGDALRAWQTEYGARVIDMAMDPAQADQALGVATSASAFAAFERVRGYTAQTLGRASFKANAARQAQVNANLAVRFVLVAGIGVSAAAMLLAWFWLKRSIAQPVVAMTSAMKALAAGDTGIVVPVVGRRDEVGAMANALQNFKDAAIVQRRTEAEAAAQREERARDQARVAAAEAAAAGEQAQVVAALAEGLDRLSHGDLAFRIEAALAPAYAKLGDDFNNAVDTLRDTMAHVAENADAIRLGTTGIASAAQDLSRRTEHQAATLEETAAAIEEITTTVSKTAAGALQARSAVASTKADAEASEAVVGEAVAAMAAIETSSRQIGQIIGLIDEIAFQTNLLALNAGVEAARAGDAGRGFAVVASEVRGLAQRSAQAAKEIKTLVTTSDHHVSRGVDLVGKAGAALDRILDQVNQISTVVGEIAASSQEQSMALREVNIAVTQMDQTTQKNAAMVEETTAASQSLADETETLAQLIGRFQLQAERDAGGRPAVRWDDAEARPALKATGTDGHAAAARSHADQDWTSF